MCIRDRRSGTIAADLPNHIPEQIKKERLQILMDIQNQISLKLNRKLVGTTQEVMIDGISKNREDMLSGRTSGNKIVVFPLREKNIWHPGDLIPIKINSAQTWNLVGQYSD